MITVSKTHLIDMGLTHSLLTIQLFPQKDLKALYNQHSWGHCCHCWGGAQKLFNITKQRIVSLTANGENSPAHYSYCYSCY